MYRDGRLPKDEQAYMWFAILDSSLDPPTDGDVKWVARYLTKVQIAQGQRLAEDWVRRHKRPHEVAPRPCRHSKGVRTQRGRIACIAGIARRYALSGRGHI